MNVSNWIYVTGAPRSGTTFAGTVLSAPLAVDYLHEPFNPQCGLPDIVRRFQYLDPAVPAPEPLGDAIRRLFTYDVRFRTGYFRNDTPARRWVKRFIGSRGVVYLRLARLNPFHRAAVIKDPIGCLMTEYLAVRHGVRPVVLIRHPVAFVASVLRLHWSADFELSTLPLAEQPGLVAAYFPDDEAFLRAERASDLEAAAALWRALNRVLLAQCARHPDWILLRHEDLSADPVPTFRELYDRLDLPWSSRIEALVKKKTGAGNRAEAGRHVQDFNRNSAEIFALRRQMLSPEERRRVLDLTGDVALAHYPEETFV